MKFFDAVIGNPPYQEMDGGNGASARPLYNRFIEKAESIGAGKVSMIVPAKWYAGGKGLDSFRRKMLSDRRIKEIVDYDDPFDCFNGVYIAGGVCYFLWDRDYDNKEKLLRVVTHDRDEIISDCMREFKLEGTDVFVRHNTALSIIRKVLSKKERLLNDVVFSRNYFSLPTTVTGSEYKQPGKIQVLTSKGTIYVNRGQVSDKAGLLEKYKVIITYAMSGGNKPTSGYF